MGAPLGSRTQPDGTGRPPGVKLVGGSFKCLLKVAVVGFVEKRKYRKAMRGLKGMSGGCMVDTVVGAEYSQGYGLLLKIGGLGCSWCHWAVLNGRCRYSRENRDENEGIVER